MTSNQNPPRAAFEVTLEHNLLRAVFEAAAVGEVINFSSIEGTLDRPLGSYLYGLIRSVRRALRRDKRMVFSNIRNVGYRRLNDKEIVSTGPTVRRRIRNATKSAVEDFKCVEFERMSNDDKLRHNAELATFAVLSFVAKEPQVKTIEKGVSDATAQLPPIGRLLEQLRRTP